MKKIINSLELLNIKKFLTGFSTLSLAGLIKNCEKDKKQTRGTTRSILK